MMAEAQRDRERLAVFEDRDRIARDLHDLVIQRLFATGLMLEGAQRRTAVPEVRDGVGKAVDELDVTIQEIRTAIFALQQGPAEALSGLRTRVLREINMAAVPLGFKPAHRFLGPIDTVVGELVGKNLIAALREALSNAFRHAEASRIDVVIDSTITLADGRPGVRLEVADDGVGIPEEAAAAAFGIYAAGPSRWAVPAPTARASVRTAAGPPWCGRPRSNRRSRGPASGLLCGPLCQDALDDEGDPVLVVGDRTAGRGSDHIGVRVAHGV